MTTKPSRVDEATEERYSRPSEVLRLSLQIFGTIKLRPREGLRPGRESEFATKFSKKSLFLAQLQWECVNKRESLLIDDEECQFVKKKFKQHRNKSKPPTSVNLHIRPALAWSDDNSIESFQRF
jgi:hypothetical protein